LLFVLERLVYFGDGCIFWVEEGGDGEGVAEWGGRYREGLVRMVRVMNFFGLLPGLIKGYLQSRPLLDLILFDRFSLISYHIDYVS
jgi:hypothetical protein